MTSPKQRIAMPLRPRPCDNCGGTGVEALWSYERSVARPSMIWQFQVSNVVCRRCGFIFVAPCYEADALLQYYAEALSYQQIDYDIDSRINTALALAPLGGRYLELGTRQKTRFHEVLSGYFREVLTQEIGTEGRANDVELHEIESGSVNVLAHYNVIEHVPDVKAFLAQCRDLLAPEGRLIIEAPDVTKYAQDNSSLVLHEHTSHLSVETLRQIAAQVGLGLVHHSRSEVSRPFNFLAVFEPSEPESWSPFWPSQVEANRAGFRAGLAVMEHFEVAIRTCREEARRLLHAGRTVVAWGVNANLHRFLEVPEGLEGLTLVDSDPRRRSPLPGQIVWQPDAAIGAVARADLLIINSRQWSEQILETIRMGLGCDLDPKKVRILDVQRAKQTRPTQDGNQEATEHGLVKAELEAKRHRADKTDGETA